MYVGDGTGISQILFNGSIVSGEIAIIFLSLSLDIKQLEAGGIFQKRRSEENGPKQGNLTGFHILPDSFQKLKLDSLRRK